MKEYTVTLTFAVDAHNEEEALVIANAAKRVLEDNTSIVYKLREVEVQTVNES